MNTTKTQKLVAYVFEDVGGWFICADNSSMLDTRGKRFESKNAAIRWLRDEVENGTCEYTHYRTGGTKPRKI